jgi:hypothetical protein
MRKHLTTIIDVAIAVMALGCAFAYWHIAHSIPGKQRDAWEMGRNSAVTVCGKVSLL